jgi:superfamily I DNA and RNA helicase
LTFEPFRLRVVGTAGSGKTQLAVQVMKDAVAQGRRPLYVCFNRPLADHIARVAPAEATVASYHHLCDLVLRDAGIVPDFSAPDVFAQLARRFAGIAVPDAWHFDVLIVDEGQDFLPEWAAALEGMLAHGAAWWWLEDPMQNLYMRDPVEFPGWVTLHATINYRSPRDIVAYLRPTLNAALDATLDGSYRIEAGSPFDGSDVALSTYASGDAGEAHEVTDATDVVGTTKRAITQALSLGFRKQDIAVLSFRGRERSQIAGLAALGPHQLRGFTGRYDLFGNPEYRDGDVMFESIYRFKGQSAPCVILTEVDFDTLDERTARKLFVGATRATMKLILVLSQRAAAALA